LKAYANPVRFMRIAKERILAAPVWRRRLVAVSDSSRQDVDALAGSARRVTTIANGVDLQRYVAEPRRALTPSSAPASQQRTIVFVGHDYVRKGLSHVIGALSFLPENWRLIVVGGASQNRRRFEIEGEAGGVGARLTFVGEVDDVRPFLNAADVFCLPSDTETMPLVALEALASGVPIVLTATCAASTLIVPGVNGRITTQDPRAIARNLVATVDETASVDRRQIRATVEAHGWETAAAGYTRLAAEVAAARRSRARRRSMRHAVPE